MKSIVFHLSLIFSTFCGINGTTTTSLQSSTQSTRSKIACDQNQCAKNWHLCDGVEDCKDGCDESAELCKLARGCTLPDTTSENETYVVNCDENTTPNAGDFVPEMSLLSFVCKPGYTRDNGDERFQSICMNGAWTPDIPSCIPKTCPKLNISDNIEYACYFNDEKIECSDDSVIGTKMLISCSLPSHIPDPTEIYCNEYGEWSVQDIQCVTECGNYSSLAEDFYQNSYQPWNVLVRINHNETHRSTISGTLIAPDLVLTVARGLTDQSNVIIPPNKVEIIINDYLDKVSQVSASFKVKKIILPPMGFLNKPNHLEEINDIAILVLEIKVDIGPTVQPVCMDWKNVILPSEASPSTGKMVISKISTHYRHQNGTLIEDIEAYPLQTCMSELETEALVGYDQFCGKYKDPTEIHKASDWGTGYFVRYPLDDSFYMKGILRASSPTKQLVFFTNLTNHIDWIRTVFKEENYNMDGLSPDVSNNSLDLSSQQVSQDPSTHTTQLPFYYGSWQFSCNAGELQVESTGACSIPPNNKEGAGYKLQCPFTASNEPKLPCNNASEGGLVPEHSVLTIQCDEGYVSTYENVEKSFCVGGQWVPKFPLNTNVELCRKSQVESLECRYQGEVIDCGDELILKYTPSNDDVIVLG